MLTSNEKEVLIDLKAIIDKFNYPMLLIGAGARRLIFDIPFDLNARATRDWDITISIKNWTEYEALREALLDSR